MALQEPFLITVLRFSGRLGQRKIKIFFSYSITSKIHQNPHQNTANRCLRSLLSADLFLPLYLSSLSHWSGLDGSSCFPLPVGNRMVFWVTAGRQVTARKLFFTGAVGNKHSNVICWMTVTIGPKTLTALLSVICTGLSAAPERHHFWLWRCAGNAILLGTGKHITNREPLCWY